MAEGSDKTDYICTIVSETKKTIVSFSNLDEAFRYIIEEFMKEGGFTPAEAGDIMNDVKKIYIESGKPADFGLWEVDNDNGELVKMLINKK
jgi:hypothetical protein